MIEPVMTVFSRGRPKYRRRRWWEWPRTVVCASGSCPALGRRVVRWWTGSRTPRRGRAVVTGLRLRIAAACPEYNPGGQLPMPAAEPVQALFFLFQLGHRELLKGEFLVDLGVELASVSEAVGVCHVRPGAAAVCRSALVGEGRRPGPAAGRRGRPPTTSGSRSHRLELRYCGKAEVWLATALIADRLR